MSEFTDEKYELYRNYQKQYKLRSVWSMYNVENLDAFSGIVADELVYRNHWGDKPVHIPLRKGDVTWGELYHAADKAIRQSGDDHHVFIERLTVHQGPNGPYVELNTGS